MTGSNQYRQTGLRKQPLVLLLLLFLFCGSMVTRLIWMQLIEGERFRELADENRIRLVPRSPIRGRILDRKGRILATSKLAYSLYLEPSIVTNEKWPGIQNRLAQLLDLDKERLNENRMRGVDIDSYRTILALDLSSEQVLRFRENARLLPGVQIDVDILRHYPNGTLAAHALGYTQSITEDEYKYLGEKGYTLRDRIGRTGVEAAYEKHLRGQWGAQMLEVNALGEVQSNLGHLPSKAGQDLTLTLDLDLQRVAEQVLAEKSGGAIVALDPRDGAILALASSPTFDPNFFSKLITTQQAYDKLFANPSLPLLSRAINPYDPGSTWKPVTAMAGLESDKFPPEIKLGTKACITYGSHCFPEHNRLGFGKIGYEDALSLSSNTFFYQVGVGVGSLALKRAAMQLGFAQKTGIELGWEESAGLVGDEDWAASGRDEGRPGKYPWILEDMASASIGQMVVQVTPLQLARAYAVFANGGWLVTPHLAAGNTNWMDPEYRSKVMMKISTLETIRKGMRKVVAEGTGYGLNGHGIPQGAGKTGTAEDSSGGLDHAWFGCYAPYPLGQIVVVAFAQNIGGAGSAHALPMAKKILEAWNKLGDY